MTEEKKARERALNAARKRKQRANPDTLVRIKESAAKCYRSNSEKYKEYMRNYHFMSKFGITAQQKDEMVAATGGLCAICGGEFADRKDAHLDHCHSTGKIRGILCGSCNRKLGWYEKNRAGVESYLALTKRE